MIHALLSFPVHHPSFTVLLVFATVMIEGVGFWAGKTWAQTPAHAQRAPRRYYYEEEYEPPYEEPEPVYRTPARMQTRTTETFDDWSDPDDADWPTRIADDILAEERKTRRWVPVNEDDHEETTPVVLITEEHYEAELPPMSDYDEFYRSAPVQEPPFYRDAPVQEPAYITDLREASREMDRNATMFLASLEIEMHRARAEILQGVG